MPRYKNKINSIHLCFTSDPFMFGYKEICNRSVEIRNLLNANNIPCTALTKGTLPKNLIYTNNINIYGIVLISLNENYRAENEPYSVPYASRIESLKYLHEKGFKTWVSIEPYPTPNILEQNFNDILNQISFVDKIIFGRLNYNKKVREYKNYQSYYNNLSEQVIDYHKQK